jgi:DNA repair photolyase
MEAWRARQRVIKTLEEKLSEEERREARQDHHAKRPPRPCGITIHTGVGCPLACAYCYIYDMGFPGSAKPYKLSPLQLAYAVATNPHVAVGPWGTLVAVGSVTEPFLPQTRELALGYMKAIAAYLSNPLQVSTKMPPPPELAEVQGGLDVLISVTDLLGKLEPRAPPPLERLRAGAELIKRGVSATLFVRPIVPGITDRDLTRLLALAAELGYRRVVFGTLRVTKGIVARLRAFGVDVAPYVRELHERRQTPIRYPKEKFAAVARQMGFEVLPASCAANVVAHGQACALCGWGPCGDVKKLKVDVRDVEEYLEMRGYKSVELSVVEGLKIRINKRLKPIDKIFLEQATRLPISEPAR